MFLTQEWIQEKLTSVWPGWKISRKLGSGTYGSVYEIYRGHPGMESSGAVLTSALKVLYMEETDREDPPTMSLLKGGSRAAALGKRDDPGITRDINLNTVSAGVAGGLYGGSSGKEDLLFQSVSGSMIDDFVNSVRTEINLMIRLKGHPHIVSIEDYEVLRDNRSCLILIRMDELDCLADIISDHHRSGRRMERAEVIRLGMEICDALDYCERNNIIHRDIKPSNLFYSEKTGFKLGDFGISRTMDSIYDRAAMSGIGTPQYMAPEIYHGEKYNNTADLYSLGIVLYALTNDYCIPFARENYEACGDMRLRDASLRRIRGEKFPPPRSADEKLGQVILKACAYDPQDRYTKARELSEALKGCLAGNSGSDENGKGSDGKKGRGKKGQDSENGLKKWANPVAAAAVLILVLFIFGIAPRIMDPILHPEVKYNVSYVDDAGNVLEEHTYKGREGEVITQSAEEREGYLLQDKTLSMTLAKDNSENRLVFTYVREQGSQTEAAAAAEKAAAEEAEKAAAAEKAATEKAKETEDEKAKAAEAAKMVEWTDPNLKKAVQDYLGIKGEMTQEVAAKVKILELKSAGITDISSLKNFTGLETLRLNDNNISDLSPVSGMRKLNLLNAEMNRISDLSPLSSMTALRGLDLNENEISDLTPLKNLTGLTMLDVRRNQVRSLEPLKGMIDMGELYASYNQIEDLSPVAGMTRLTYLAITDNKIKDISCLKNMTELAVLTMRDNQVTDISVLRNLKKIYHLKISGNPIKDYSPLDDYPEKAFLEK